MPQRRPRFDLRGPMTPQKMEQLNQLIEELYSLVNLASSHNLIDNEVHRDTLENVDDANNINEPSVERGDLITGQITPQGADRIKWQRLDLGAANNVLRSDGVDAAWAKVQLDSDVDDVLPVPNGGTGVSSLTDHAVLLGNGSNDIETVSGLGTTGQVLTSNGAGADPTWQDTGGETHEDGYWSPLTDGDVDETLLIFGDGEAIMMWVPTP